MLQIWILITFGFFAVIQIQVFHMAYSNDRRIFFKAPVRVKTKCPVTIVLLTQLRSFENPIQSPIPNSISYIHIIVHTQCLDPTWLQASFY